MSNTNGTTGTGSGSGSTTTESARFQSASQFDAQTRTLALSMVGEADLDSVESLRQLLEKAHEEAQRVKAEEVALDLTQLEFLNSSGIKHFVTWFRNASELPPESGYRIRLISSPLVPWQRRSLDALRCFAPKLLTIDTVAT